MRRLTANDAELVQELCDRCDDYYQLVFGAPADPGEGAKLLAELPPGKTLADKFFFALDGGGVLDIVRDYREPGEWYLGLLLFPPEARARGAGSRALAALVEWLKPQGARRLRLAVAEQNEAARRFWERHGFHHAQAFPPRQVGTRMTALLELVREL